MKIAFGSVVAALVLSLSTAGAAWAQGNANNKPADKKKVKTYDFSGDDIDGDLIKPDGDFLDARRTASRTSLIRVRTNFLREILKSAEDL